MSTPGPSRVRKRDDSTPEDSTGHPQSKKFKASSPTKANKRRPRKRKRKQSIVTPGALNGPPPKSSSVQSSFQVTPCTQQKAETNELKKLPSDISSPSGVRDDKDDVISKLKASLLLQTQLLEKHEKSLDVIKQSLTCQVCLDPLLKPYALAPCGHIACYDCLIRWFTTPSQDPNELELQDPNTFFAKKKTCPHCRVTIRQRPVEVWSIKEMANSLVQHNFLQSYTEDSTVLSKDDPWQNIFRPPTSHFLDIDNLGIHDDEDGVYRCYVCHHEIVDGLCMGCGRSYDPMFNHIHIDDDDDDDDNDDLMHFPFGQIFDLGFPGDIEVESYEGSFIDDGEDDDADHGVINLLDSNDEGADSDDESVQIRAPTHLRRRRILEISSDDEDDPEPEIITNGGGDEDNGASDGSTDHYAMGYELEDQQEVDSDEEDQEYCTGENSDDDEVYSITSDQEL